MKSIQITVKEKEYLPSRAHAGDAGYDLKAYIPTYPATSEAEKAICYARSRDQLILVSGRLMPTDAQTKNDIYHKSGIYILPQERRLISCGFCVDLGHPQRCMLLVPRSGLAARYGLTLSNSPGVIDSNYRGWVMVSLYNTGRYPAFIADKDRIAQGLIVETKDVEWEICSELDSSERGHRGFGSSGV